MSKHKNGMEGTRRGTDPVQGQGNNNLRNYFGPLSRYDVPEESMYEAATDPFVLGHPDPATASTSDVVPTGLLNAGNTCYMNAVLQMLFDIELLRERTIQAAAHQSSSPRLLRELAGTFTALAAGSQAFDTGSLCACLQDLFADEWRVCQQHDAHEFLLRLIEKIDELVAASEDLSKSSKEFYKKSKKLNSCCVIV